MVVRRTDWVSARNLCAGGGFTCSTRFAPAHGQRAIRADRCAATGAAWFSRSALRHSHTDIGPSSAHNLWRNPRGFLRGEVIVSWKSDCRGSRILDPIMLERAHMIAMFQVFGLIMAGSIICLATEGSQSTAGESLEARRQHHEDTVLGYLRDVAWSSRKAIRLYYQADCQSMKNSGVDYSVPFPFFPLQSPSADKTGVAAVREIFKN